MVRGAMEAWKRPGEMCVDVCPPSVCEGLVRW